MCFAIIETIRPDDISASPIIIDVEVLFDLKRYKKFKKAEKIPEIEENARKFVIELAKLNKYSLIIYLNDYFQEDVELWLKYYELDKYFWYFYTYNDGACCMQIDSKMLANQSFDEILEFLDKNNLCLDYKRKITYLKDFPIPDNWKDYVED